MNLFVYWTNEKGGEYFFIFICVEGLLVVRTVLMFIGCVFVHRERVGDASIGRPHSPRSHQTVSAGPGQSLGKTRRGDQAHSYIYTYIHLHTCKYFNI